jgi:hypothetical protein
VYLGGITVVRFGVSGVRPVNLIPLSCASSVTLSSGAEGLSFSAALEVSADEGLKRIFRMGFNKPPMKEVAGDDPG